ncbi:MAG: MTH895/ArsE family thioredoxin-like protein [Candidatus Electrothrix scaldis]|nr:MAG: MTH895/ArsE family thioredoxin-like protein [Candidatus Electrothrix sp. GW3-3]
MDAATQRFIRIGTASIGLIGLDIALNTIARKEVNETEAVDFLFSEISRQNYIPPGNTEKYKEALLKAYRKHCNISTEEEGLVIRIFGTGCVTCNSLQILVIEILDRLKLAADIEQIHDPDEIGRAGVTMTPALMINGTLKSTGLMPTPAQVEQWIQGANNV